VLLNVLVGSTASSASVLLSHWFAFWITILLSGLNIYLVWKDHPRGVGPLLLTLFATPLIMLNPAINLMMDKKIIVDSTLAMSRLLNFVTWVGVIEMTFAAAWNSSLDRKVGRRCCCCFKGLSASSAVDRASRVVRRNMLGTSSFDEI
jgi:hypothetical protein